MPGIVGGDQDQRARDAGVGGGEERIGGHVHADVLHGDERAGAGEGRAEPHLEGHLLVGRPLGAAAEGGEGLQDLGGGRARVAGAEARRRASRRGQGDRLVSAPQPASGRLRRNRLHDLRTSSGNGSAILPFRGPCGKGWRPPPLSSPGVRRYDSRRPDESLEVRRHRRPRRTEGGRGPGTGVEGPARRVPGLPRRDRRVPRPVPRSAGPLRDRLSRLRLAPVRGDGGRVPAHEGAGRERGRDHRGGGERRPAGRSRRTRSTPPSPTGWRSPTRTGRRSSPWGASPTIRSGSSTGRTGSPISRTSTGLVGRRVGIGPPRSGTYAIARQLLATYGIDSSGTGASSRTAFRKGRGTSSRGGSTPS